MGVTVTGPRSWQARWISGFLDGPPGKREIIGEKKRSRP